MIREEIAAEQQELLIYGDLAIDLARREVSLDDAVVRLKPKEYELLVFLARNRGVALSRDLILERVWGWEHDAGSRTVDVHIRWLREKIEPDPTKATRIITVRGIGYRFEG
jgi:DNA-binding response OmpR family regulator